MHTEFAGMSAVIQTHALSKSFGNFAAVRDVSLAVEPNEVYGFLGPNGAGKTTTIKILLGLQTATRGQAWIFGQPAAKRDFATRQRIGVVGEQQVFYDDMSAREYLRFFGTLYRVQDLEKRIATLLERFSLAAAADARARSFSRGMQQKLGFIRALLHGPELLVLDEPVSALDPKAVVEIREVLQEEVARGSTVLISSHLLTEVEQLADRVGIMHKGRLVAEDSVSNIKARWQPQARLFVELAGAARDIAGHVQDVAGVHAVTCTEKQLTVSLQSDDMVATRARVSKAITRQDGVIVQMQMEEVTLEQAFVSLTDQKLQDWTSADAP